MAAVVVDTDAAPPSPVVGAQKRLADVVKTVTIGTHATGGVSVTPAMLGLSSVLFAVANPASGYVFQYDIVNSKLIAYRSGAANGVLVDAGAVDLSAVSTRLYARGVPA